MKKTLAVLFATGLLFSCKQPATETEVTKAPIDSLIANWSTSWNNHDSAGARNLFTSDALLIDDNLITKNTDEISTKWIHPNIHVVTHFKATQLQTWSAADRAGYTGRYDFDAVVNDSVVAKPTGVFTVNWIKGDNGDWKITTCHIHGITKSL